MQRTLRKIKQHLDENEYNRMYPTGSGPGFFYTAAKVHKLQNGEGLNELTMRPIISNIGTATYETAKFLNSLLAPLGKSDRSSLHTEAFVNQVKDQRIPEGYKMIPFDVKSLFTNVPLNETIDIILIKVYDENKIDTKIPKSILKELLYLCTKHVHFKFNNEIYIQCDGATMGSPLGPLLANIFMISLEDSTLPKLELYLCNWKRYVDDTFAYVLPDKIDMILHELHSYHPNIKFTYELEPNNKLAFFDVSARRTNDNKVETSVYRKATCTNIYINWHSHAPSNWKIGILRNLIKRAKSSELLLRNEISYLRNIFTEYNDFPLKVVYNIIDQELSPLVQQETTKPENKETQQTLQLMIPYSGNQGRKLLSKMKKQLKKTLPEDVNTMISYKSTKLSTKFPVKDKTDFQHKNNVVYHSKYPNEGCHENYIGETNRRIVERIQDHNSRDKNSQLLKHAREKGHTHVWENDFKILGNNYQSNIKRKISESLFIRQLKPTLNANEKSFPLHLFN